ncbi:MAG: hypothetical protein JO257_33975 [Deltaproteobacteria bacterium]|nr:hypothetical protein [Deltaproteobacteria bacterium]
MKHLWLFVLAACGSSGHSVVPPDLRDVERAGEGLVSATFGSAPDRMPDWPRATQVLGLLESVWNKSKAATPDLPPAQVKQVDDAIAQLHAAIPAMDQKKAAYAANAVGLAVPPLFQHFNPDAPEEVVRLDAVFRQIGLDGHFADWSAAAADLASMKTDWDHTKAQVSARVPTCHRVGGTATVVGDIDASLDNLATSVSAMNIMTTETESDNGALEIDTLELLFDCPPDNTTPSHGLGAACKKDGDCDAGEVCDLSNAGGKCAPDPANAQIGTRCTTTVDCGTDPRSACQTEAGDGYPGGYCFMEPCDDVQTCPPGSTCVALGGESPGCFKTCTTDADCVRQPASASEHYVCQLFSTTPPTGFGPANMACSFPCARDSDCDKSLTCDVASGKCKP